MGFSELHVVDAHSSITSQLCPGTRFPGLISASDKQVDDMMMDSWGNPPISSASPSSRRAIRSSGAGTRPDCRWPEPRNAKVDDAPKEAPCILLL